MHFYFIWFGKMKYYIKLSRLLISCPTCWINFIKYINPTGNISDKEFDDHLLKNYNAIYVANHVNNAYKPILKFKSLEDMTFFRLKWN